MKKILLDENLPVKLKNYFSDDVKVFSVPDLGWQSKKNGELLKAMDETGLDFLVTVDKNLRYQQNLEKFNIQVVVLYTYDNRFKTLAAKVEEIENNIKQSEPTSKIIEIDLRAE